jgi:hypothetical protein
MKIGLSSSICIGIVLAIAIALVLCGCGPKNAMVASTSPNPGAADVPVNPPVVEITFDQPMDRASVETAIVTAPAPGTPTFSWSNDDKTVSANYSQPLAPNTTYTATVGKNAAAANKATLGQDYVLKFTTVQAAAVPPAPTTGTTPATESGRGPSMVAVVATTTFTKDIQPLAATRCKPCHQGQMADYANIIAKKYVIAGKSAESPYYLKPSGKSAHPGGNVWKDQADIVKKWIDSGAAK